MKFGDMNKRRISVFGLGYVGTVSAACLAENGHEVIGVDPNETKVNLIRSATAPILEKDVPEMVARAVARGVLRATCDSGEAVTQSDISLVCVGTPSKRDGSLDTSAVERVCEEIGAAIARKSGEHVVAIRSTILPGTMRKSVIPMLEDASGRKLGDGLLVCNNPEFLREGSAVYDYFNPAKTVIGGSEPRAVDIVASLYDDIEAPMIRTSLETAEMVKYTDNTWHALKVAFGNEIGNLCKAIGIDSHEVMDIFFQDRKLNISPYYLRPGFAFGGSCLPKDVRALTFKGRSLALDLPLLGSILPSNRVQIERAIELILSKGKKPISFLGFSFKEGTDDLRESPQVELIERLIGKGYNLRLYDRNVRIASLTGANRSYIMESIPHIASLMVETLDEALLHGELVIVGNNAPEFVDLVSKLQPRHMLIDLVRLPGVARLGDRYDGINW